MIRKLECSSTINSGSYSLTLDKDFELNVALDSTIYLVVDSVKNNNLNINLSSNVNSKIILINRNKSSYNLTFNVSFDSSLVLFTSDYVNKDISINKTVNLNGVNASFNGYEYISNDDSNLTGSTIINHLSKDTFANSKCYYLVKKNGYTVREIKAVINKGMDNSISSESLKGMLMNEKSRIDAKPVLVISNDDVKASHGCAIGTVDQNEIYYLMSRGLTRTEALEIISKSLIAPILREIKDEEFLNEVNDTLFESIGE